MSEDVLSSDVDAATKMITDTAAEGVEFIFGTAFKEDMQDEMTITVIAAGFGGVDGYDVSEEEPEEEIKTAPVSQSPTTPPPATPVPDDNIMQIDNPLIDGLGMSGNSSRSSSSNDLDIDEIFKILGN